MSGRLSIREDDVGGTDIPTHVLRIRLPRLDTILPIALVIVVVFWRTWAVLRSSFQGDDWDYVARAVRVPLLAFLTTQHAGHLQPGQFALVWATSRIAPLNFGVAMAPLLAITFIAGLLLWRLLAALFGDRPANLIPLAVFMLCPLSIPSSLWWAAALTILPLQAFIIGTLFAVLVYVRDRSNFRLASVGLVYGFAVLFWEKAVLILPLTFLFVVLFLGRGTGIVRVRDVTAGLWRLWAVLSGITAAYAAWYVGVAKGEVAGTPTLIQLRRLIGTTIGSTVVPTYLGGPWSASVTGRAFVAELPLRTRLLTWIVAGLIVVISVLRYRQAWRAWTLPLVYIGLSAGLVAVGRLPIIGAGSALGSRYYADSVAVFAVVVALAFTPPLDRRYDPGWSPRAGTVRLRWLGIAVTLAYAASALITSFHMADAAQKDSARGWLAAVRQSLNEHPEASVVDGYLPARAAPPALEQARLSGALAPIAPGIRWNGPDERPLIFDQAGHLWPVQVGSATSIRSGPVPDCGYRTGGTSVTVPFEPPLFSWTWGVRLSYSAPIRGRGSVSIDGDRQPVQFIRGSHVLVLFHRGAATTVTIESGSAPICVRAVQVGRVRARVLGG